MVITALVIGLPIVLIGGFILLNSEPDKLTEKQREEAIDEILGRRANLGDADIKTGDTTFVGKYGSFSYPASAEIYEYKDTETLNNESDLESFSFDMENPRRIFNYSVTKSNVSSLDDIPSVSFRENSSNGYKVKEEKLADAPGLSFTKDRSGEFMAEKTGYFLVDGNLYSISVTASSLEDASKLYGEIIASFILK